MPKPVRLGRLRHRLVLHAPVELDDGAGGVVRSYEPAATLWAAIEPVAAERYGGADRQGARITHRITLRRRAGLTTCHRLARGTALYEIRSYDDTEDDAHTIVLAEEIKP